MHLTALRQAVTQRDAALYERLRAAYGDDETLIAIAWERLGAALRRYADAFDNDVDVVVTRAPGRVNLIGEHTDYNGLPVMPMAISRDVLIVAGARPDHEVRAVNVDKSFGDRGFTIERAIAPFAAGDWGNYIKSALQGLIEFWGGTDGLQGVNLAMNGNVPIASGLSSSAACTIAAALAVMARHGRTIEPLVFAETMARSDHYVGMASGGMDQAAAILGQSGAALAIEFHPLRVQPVQLPPATTIVVCHSRVKAAKAGNARDEYNRRVVECRLATAVLHAKSAARTATEPVLLSEWLARDTRGFEDALRQIAAHLQPDGYTAVEIARALKCPVETVRQTLCATTAGNRYDEPEGGFKLQQRARHAISETQRVQQTRAVLAAMPVDAAATFGQMMNASHESCRNDYEISCTELDELVMLAREAGALGARLTGAGFGGCTVNLLRAGTTPAFMRLLNERYYVPRALAQTGETMFAFAPAAGAGVLIA